MQYDTENQKTKAKLQRKQNYYTTQMFPSSKKGNKPHAPLANVQTRFGQGVWWRYPWAGFGWQYGVGQYPLLIVVSQEVEADLYMFGFWVEDWVFSYAYGTGAVTKQRHSPKL